MLLCLTPCYIPAVTAFTKKWENACIAITAFIFSNHLKFSWSVNYIHRITHAFLFFVLCSRLFYCIESSSSFIRAADSVSLLSFSILTATAHHQRILWVCGRATLRIRNLDVILCFILTNEEKIAVSKCKNRYGKKEKRSAELSKISGNKVKSLGCS